MSRIDDGSQVTTEAVITNGRISAVVDPTTGLLSAVVLRDGRRVPITQNFYVYEAEGRKTGEKPSGAYAFNPANRRPKAVADRAAYKVVRGPLVEEVHQVRSH